MNKKFFITTVLMCTLALSSSAVFASDTVDDSVPATDPAPEVVVVEGSTPGEPVVTEPVVAEPVITDPVVTTPVVTTPVVTTPSTTDPTDVTPSSTDLVVTTPSTDDDEILVKGVVLLDSSDDEELDVEPLALAVDGLALGAYKAESSETPMLRGTGAPESEPETPDIGARSATNSSGDVFLGGNYLEVGISRSGSFGTSTSAPSDFHSHASGQLGLLMDGDGWDVGNPPTTGDFFLPGTEEERYGVAYELNGRTYQYFAADRVGDTNITAYTTDESDVSNGLLKATVHATTPHNVVVENTYSFGVDDKYYRTEVVITNNSGYEISNVRFLRSFDPDQDRYTNRTYDTYNKVICNPDSSQPGGENNFAMVVARGAVSLEGFFLVSFDNRARASHGVDFSPDSLYLSGLWVESDPNLPTYSTDEALEMSFDNTNGYVREDNAIAMTFHIGTLADGETTELSHFSSLDPDVIESINKIKEAINATVDNTTDNTLTIVVEPGYEYSIDGGETWSTTGVFEGLDPDTEYTVLTRPINGTEEDTTEVVVSTKKSGPETPDITAKIVTENSITVKGGENYEYSIDDGETWQDSPEFNSLNPETEYTIVARIKGTEDTMPGKNSNPLTVSTLAPAEESYEEYEIVTVSVELNGSIDSISINKGELFAAIGEDLDISVALNEGQDIEIKFIVNDSSLSSEELELVNSQLKNGEAIALTVDISIELYIDNEFVKNIIELETPITYTLTLPESILEGNTNFAVISTHAGENGNFAVLRIDDSDGEKATITISSKDFSNYTIVCEKEEEEVVAAAGSVSTDSTAGTTVLHLSTPGTGDNIMLYVAMLIVACANLVILSIIERKKSLVY